MLDLRGAFHSLMLLGNSKRYCEILPYFGSTSYLYQRIYMGLNISPSIHKQNFGLSTKQKIL